MDEEEDHLSDTQINDIFEKDRISETQTNNIFDNLLTESQIEEMVKDWFDVSQPESDKKDGDDESSIAQKRKTVIVHTSNFAQIGAGRVEPEKEKNPQHENQQLQHDSYQVEVENNPIIDKQQDGVIKKGERLKTFKNKLFQSSFIPTPKHLQKKRAIVNIDNSKENDEKCFLWSVVAHLFPTEKHANRVFNYKKYLNQIEYGDIKMPMALKDIDKFEKLNNLIINVYGCTENGKEIWPRRISKKRGKEAINLLMLEDENRYHYVLIKNFDRLLGKSDSHPKNFCPYCCHGFDKRSLKDGQIDEHMTKCFTYGGTRIVLPEKGKNDILKFKNYSQQLEAPYTIYADFEAVLKKDEDSGNVIHEISGYSICVKSPYEQDQMCSYRGEDAGKVFIGHIQSLCKELDKKNMEGKCRYDIWGKGKTRI